MSQAWNQHIMMVFPASVIMISLKPTWLPWFQHSGGKQFLLKKELIQFWFDSLACKQQQSVNHSIIMTLSLLWQGTPFSPHYPSYLICCCMHTCAVEKCFLSVILFQNVKWSIILLLTDIVVVVRKDELLIFQ